MHKTMKYMSFKKILTVIVLLFTITYNSKAQTYPKAFSEDNILFLQEMTEFFKAADKREGGDFMEQFTLTWNSGKISDSKKATIYKTCNFMLKKKYKALNEFKNYLNSVNGFVNNATQDDKSFTAWQQSIDKIMNSKNSNKLANYLAMSENLFSRNVIFKSPTTEWGASSNNYTFDFDSIPKVIFGNTDIYCFAKSDSISIKKTKGVFYPLSDRWEGFGGIVDWERADLPANEVFAELKKYTLNMRSAQYEVDSVKYTNTKFFGKPLYGKLRDKVVADMRGERAFYPEFESYDKRFVIKDLFKDVDYDGGFLVKGAKILGAGSVEHPAMIRIKREGKLFFTSSALSYIIRPDKVSSDKAEIKFFFDADSIYHPGITFKYDDKAKQVFLFRDNQALAQSPYFNTFHKLDMKAEAIYWKIGDPKIDIKMVAGANESRADFESANLFSSFKYEKLQGMDDVNPLVRVRNYSKSINSKEFKDVGLSQFLQMPMDQIKLLLVELTAKGFLNYNSESGHVKLKDRLFDHVNAAAGKIDYDVIQFNSLLQGNQVNASINLLNYDLKIYGVEKIFLSDSQKVTLFPAKQTITVKKNRDFNFAGIINAGNFQFYGKEFFFDYDKFKIDLNSVDSLRIKVKRKVITDYDQGEYEIVKSVIEDVSGDLVIDKPFNKSGRVSFPEYPIFTCNKNSFVYWDKKHIFDGVYTRDKFYFKNDPFVIDSLDNFSTEGLRFKGVFNSAGILPELNEDLAVQEDYSLGFKRQSPPEGFSAYGGKGAINGVVKMSNQGLRSDGDIKYVTSTTKSNDFKFFPDSMNTDANSFVNDVRPAPKEFPPVLGENVYVHWEPYKDFMDTYKKEKALDFFNGQALLHGNSTLTPEGMHGKGRMDFAKAELFSKRMDFKEITFTADTSDFRMNNEGMDELSFETNNVNAFVDFKERYAEFKSNGEGSIVKFPANQYICYMDQFKWFMDKATIEMSSEKKAIAGAEEKAPEELSDIDLSGTQFISVHPNQDSLSFYSPAATYDLRKNIIRCREVKYINIADARLFPDSGKVTIYKKARLDRFTNARILANIVTKYHMMYEAVADVFGKKSYTGNAYYDYEDELKQKHRLRLTKIDADTTGQTIAEGEVDSTGLALSPAFTFKGKVKLIASNPFLTFNGGVSLAHTCGRLGNRYFAFNSEINPEEIFIPVDKVIKDKMTDEFLGLGILSTVDSVHAYSAFFSKKNSYSDVTVVGADGLLFYDKAAKEFKVSSKDKIREISLPGNYVSFNTDNCVVYGEGKMDYGTNFGQMKTLVYGNGTHNLNNDSIFFDAIMAMDFFFDNSALKVISDKLEENMSLQPINLSRPVFEKGIQEILGKEEADKQIANINLAGTFKRFPKELEHTIMFYDIKMRWNTASKSYISEGPIGIGNMGDKFINKFVNGRIQLIRKRSGDVLNMYLQLDDNTWYYFNYQASLMQALSSDEKFNTIIKELKPDKRKMQTEKGTPAYQFILSTERKKKDFLKKMDNLGAAEEAPVDGGKSEEGGE